MAESASGRRRPWAAALCFVCCRGDGEAGGKLRRPKERKLRTVPVPVRADGSAEDDQGVRRGEDAAGKVSLLRTFCCFLPPARTPRRKRSSAQQERMPAPAPGPRNGDDDPPAEASPTLRAEQRIVAPTAAAEIDVAAATTTTTPRDADTNGGSSDEALSVAARAGASRVAAYFQGEFGPAAGLCVVAAASVAGLLGGRLLAVIACLCAWLFALWIRRRRRRLEAGTGSKGSEQR
ncbi:hypothetical protein ACQ4PT_000866 [Festuca glaucescens]